MSFRLRLADDLNDLDSIASDMSFQKLSSEQIEPVRKAVEALERAVKAIAQAEQFDGQEAP